MKDFDYLEYLIEIGQSMLIPNREQLSQNSLRNRVWLPDSWKQLGDDQLVYLFKGLVLLEEYWFSNGEHIGSTTDTKFVYREIQNRQLDNDYKIGDWAYQYSSNPYVPLDTGNRHGAKTIYNYLQWQADLVESVKKEKEDAIQRKEERKRLKAEAHAERLKLKEIRDRELGYRD